MPSVGLRNLERVDVHIFFEDDRFDAHFSLPDLDVAFHTPGASAKVQQYRVRDAQTAAAVA